MNARDAEPAGEDDAAAPTDLARELETVNAELARLTAENAELRRALGEPINPPAAKQPRKTKRAPGAYREPDARAKLEEALDAANAAVASLGIDNSILQSRVDEKNPAQNFAKIGRWIGGVTIGLVILGTLYAVMESPRVGGAAMMLLDTVAVGFYAGYGWFLYFTRLSHHSLFQRMRAQQVTSIAAARKDKPVVVCGVVQGRDTAFDAWFPDGQRAVWQAVRVTEVGRRSSRRIADQLYEADSFHVVDADGGSIRIEPAGARIVPETHGTFGWKLSATGQQGLRDIRGFQGDRDALVIDVELVRLGASVMIEGRLSGGREAVMRHTPRTPLTIVVLGIDGIDAATRSVQRGLRIGAVFSVVTVALGLATAQLLAPP